MKLNRKKVIQLFIQGIIPFIFFFTLLTIISGSIFFSFPISIIVAGLVSLVETPPLGLGPTNEQLAIKNNNLDMINKTLDYEIMNIENEHGKDIDKATNIISRKITSIIYKG